MGAGLGWRETQCPITNQHSTMNYYYKYCGTKAVSIASLAASTPTPTF
jgi:hypothetical protein